jgi:hypothetical protein
MSQSPFGEDRFSGMLPGGNRIVEIGDIIQAIHQNHIRIFDHADEEAQSDHLSFDEVFASVFQGEIIEEYPEDKPYPSCVVYGETFKKSPSAVFGRIMNRIDGRS